ncbi:MAG: hypothetical protein M0P91_05530 [Sulfuricurvum sp.]|jgi:predicted acetyltransferase|uniref:GNAT family N-acetyltransferase n=1 Tax=Sulfuricurvum sp. TaxID=2025608 RepID=UPI0025EA42EC|nr:hypothetical protein [Sulfuricurvum sp.]MCK9372638.1 hypothetical protein [Sulfuricurvum sp.]
MTVHAVTDENLFVYLNLIQCYEAEFSRITHKKPNKEGLFELDTHLGETVSGWLLMIGETPAALAAITHTANRCHEVCEFYVVPSFRHQAVGIEFAHQIWRIFPGEWVIKQIEGAEYASKFWRKAITAYHQTPYREDRYNDPYWGVVTRQRFNIL